MPTNNKSERDIYIYIYLSKCERIHFVASMKSIQLFLFTTLIKCISMINKMNLYKKANLTFKGLNIFLTTNIIDFIL